MSPITGRPYLEFILYRTHSDVIWVSQYPNEGETKHHMFLISLMLGYYILISHLIHMSWYVLSVHIHPHINETSYCWKLVKNWWPIFIVGPASARDNAPVELALPLGNYITPKAQPNGNYITPNTSLLGIILHLTRHFCTVIHHYK